MIYQPKKYPKKVSIICVLLYGLGGTGYFIGEFVASFRMFFQLSAVIAVAFGMMLMARYLLTDHRYVISDIERMGDEVKFTIVKINGKRENVMATFNFDSIYAFEKTSLKELEGKYGKVNKVYNYCQNFRAKDVYRMAIDFNGMKIVFVIECDDVFARAVECRMIKREETQQG